MHPVSLRLIGVLTLASGLLAGCSQSLESNPTFQEHVARVEKIEESSNETKNRLVLLNNEFQAVSKDITTLVTNGPQGGVPAEQFALLAERVANLEKSLQGLNENLVALNQKTQVRESRTTVQSESTGSDADIAAANAPGSKDAPKKVTRTSRKSEGKATARRRSAGTTEAAALTENAKSGGQYHQVREGETIEKIAQQYRTSPKVILNANRIPVGRQVMAGQQIYVPNS